ncbi:hypothetical protein KCP70_05005 [Salmonella enterica subsp. enterica]|nr:hypothetical protein KCP70_05005 [Salmonella enterica subsp. enterica]
MAWLLLMMGCATRVWGARACCFVRAFGAGGLDGVVGVAGSRCVDGMGSGRPDVSAAIGDRRRVNG